MIFPDQRPPLIDYRHHETVTMYPSSLFPAPAYPASIYPGAGKAVVVVPSYFEKDLLAYLGTFGMKVYPGHVPQKVSLPAITFFLIHEQHLKTLAGSAGQCVARYQIAVSSTRYMEVGATSELIRKSFERAQFRMGATFVGSALADEGRTRYEGPLARSDRGVHSKIREFVFQYDEAIPTF